MGVGERRSAAEFRRLMRCERAFSWCTGGGTESRFVLGKPDGGGHGYWMGEEYPVHAACVYRFWWNDRDRGASFCFAPILGPVVSCSVSAA